MRAQFLREEWLNVALGVCTTLFGLLLDVRALAAESAQCSVAKHSIERASVIRGLRQKNKVPCTIETRVQVQSFLEHTIRTKISKDKLYYDGLVAKALGFIPEDFDYEKGLLNLYLTQLGGYYDPDKKRYVMAGWLPEIMQPSVAVHELTHALQDQHYDLNKFIDDKRFTTDELLARSALVEGDATLVMLDYQREFTGEPPVATLPDVDSFIVQTVLGMALTNTIGVPESLKATLVFPYVSGARFAHALLKNGGYSAVDRAFLRPPRSTREILHPDEYLAEKGKAENASSDDSSPATYRDTLGEFSISALFVGEQSLKSRAAQIAAGWEDDIVRVNGARGAEEVIWETRWQTDQDAGEFESAYRQLLVSRAQAIKNNASNGQSTIEIDQWKIEITRSAPRETRFLARRTNNASNL